MEELQHQNNRQGNDGEGAHEDSADKRASYPSRDLSFMINWCKTIYTELGHTRYHKNETIAAVHGVKAVSIKPMLSTGQHYKLLELKHGVGYKLTSLFHKLVLPANEGEYRGSVLEALSGPELYKEWFAAYDNHIVPAVENLKNYLIREKGYKDANAIKAAEIFWSNLKEHALVNRANVLVLDMAASQPTDVEEKKELPARPLNQEGNSEYTSYEQIIQVPVPVDEIRIPVPIAKGMAYVVLPKDYNDSDLDMVARIVRAYMKAPPVI